MKRTAKLRISAVLLLALLGPVRGPAQETRSPLPYIAAPPNTASSPPSSEAPIVERVPPRPRTGPPRIACWAIPSNSKAYAGYYVGGGTAFCWGQPRMEREGTWGWDYRGCWLPHRVFLQWWHGRRSQGGAGAYRIDGPRLFHALHQQRSQGQGPP